MTISDAMFSRVKAARHSLTPEGLRSVQEFLSASQHEGGGFINRASQPDLYYSVFGLEACQALGAAFDLDRAAAFVLDDEDVDLVHHCCRVRCANRLGLLEKFKKLRADLRGRLNKLVAASVVTGGHKGIKNAFLAALAYEDLGGEVPNARTALRLLRRYELSNGSFRNVEGTGGGLVTATAAAVVVQRRLTGESPVKSVAWLRSLYMDDAGGFRVAETAPVPDLLSTATALFALSYCGESLAGMAESCEEFIAGQWQPCGGFAGHVGDSLADCEYTYYALLALGCLA